MSHNISKQMGGSRWFPVSTQPPLVFNVRRIGDDSNCPYIRLHLAVSFKGLRCHVGLGFKMTSDHRLCKSHCFRSPLLAKSLFQGTGVPTISGRSFFLSAGPAESPKSNLHQTIQNEKWIATKQKATKFSAKHGVLLKYDKYSGVMSTSTRHIYTCTCQSM